MLRHISIKAINVNYKIYLVDNLNKHLYNKKRTKEQYVSFY